jgi:type IV pilus assembly protein PilW
MKREIRMAGYDPAAVDGIDDDGINGVDDPAESANSGFVTAARDLISFDWDMNYNGVIDATGIGEQITYSFLPADDTNFDGIADNGSAPLTRDLGGATVPASMADDIEAVGFAYAFDDNVDGDLDVSPNGNVIWAYDSDGDGDLDTVLDTNDDGLINTADTAGGAALSPAFTAAEISIASVEAVRIWLLGRTRSPIRGHRENRVYVVGDRRVNPAGDNFQRRLLVETIYCRNM